MNDRAAEFSANDAAFPIPSRLNTVLVVLVFTLQASLLVVASRVSWPRVIVIGVVFAYAGLTNYALMHEGSHGALHRRRGANWLLGTLTGMHFPASFTLMKETHIVHHCCNRTDHEMFDQYYESDNLLVKFAQWYSILLGLFWVVIPVGSILLAVYPPLLRTRLFKRAKSAAVLFEAFGPREQALIAVEVLLMAGWYALLAFFFGLSLWPTLVLFAMFAFNWSTRQYVTHAWSERDVLHGAHNLRVAPPMSAILLNGEWDRVHHENPGVSWLYLPRLGRESNSPRPHYISQYLSLWKGPKPATEPPPEVLKNSDLP